mmetsp:Transcript_55592/g.155982  ORF Transcript_55592/g.155982 Transcript_55592/m.155982 type:complete len:211 (+) Transcript_55592:86-718(+)
MACLRASPSFIRARPKLPTFTTTSSMGVMMLALKRQLNEVRSLWMICGCKPCKYAMPELMPELMLRRWRLDNSTSHLSYNSSYKLPPSQSSVTMRIGVPKVQAPMSLTKFGCSSDPKLRTSLQNASCCCKVKRLLLRYSLMATAPPFSSPAKMSAVGPAMSSRCVIKSAGSISTAFCGSLSSMPSAPQEAAAGGTMSAPTMVAAAATSNV